MIIDEPKTEEQFQEYYELRWSILRKHLEQARGSEKDEFENEAIHVMAVDMDKIIGVGRGHFVTSEQAQIRYMAVDINNRGKGIGSLILKDIEKKLKANGAKKVFLNSRDSAVDFYKRHGYKIIAKGQLLFGIIEHFRMEKDLL